MPQSKRFGRNEDSEESSPFILNELRVKQTSPRTDSRDVYIGLKNRILQKLSAELDPGMDVTKTAEVRVTIQELFEVKLAEESIVLTRNEKRQLFETVVAELLGYGPLEQFLNMDGITAIMVNGPKNVYIERADHIQPVNVTFDDHAHLLRIIDRILIPLGLAVDRNTPMANGLLADGSPVNIIIPPVCLNGATITIHHRSLTLSTMSELIERDTLTSEAVDFLDTCVKAGQRIFVCGTVNSGKTTLLRMLGEMIPPAERIILIDDMIEELQLQHPKSQHIRMNPRHSFAEQGLSVKERLEIAVGIPNARIILTEGLSKQYWHPSFLDTLAQSRYLAEIVGRSSRAAILNLSKYCLHYGGHWSPERALATLTNSLDLIVCLERSFDGSRRVIAIDAIVKSTDLNNAIRPLFAFEYGGVGPGKIIGNLKPVENHAREFLNNLPAL